MLLVINTAFSTANLALKTSNRTILKDIDDKSKHSESVLKVIDEMCEEAQVDVLDIDTVAVVVGPGSFTGLRIGTAIVKALGSVKNDLNILPLSSLELLGSVVIKEKLCKQNFVCVLNALSDLFFVAYFDKTGIKLEEEKMIGKDEFLKIKEPIFSLKNDLKGYNTTEIDLNCEDVLEFAEEKAKEKKFVSCDELTPVYLRLSQAEDNLLKKQKKID